VPIAVVNHASRPAPWCGPTLLFRLAPIAVVNHTVTTVMALALISLSFTASDAILMALTGILGARRGLPQVTRAIMVARMGVRASAPAWFPASTTLARISLTSSARRSPVRWLPY
jgi:hypothetical protein